jgi:XTP/dITP diphosphohydrolase
MKLLIATGNRHKLSEIREMLIVPGLEVVGADGFPGLPEVEEDGDSFEANAVKKAVVMGRAAGTWALADDSGLEVEALSGAPGVRSARYAGEPVSYEANNRKLLREMEGRPDRRARFRCVIALAAPGGQTRTVEGACEGRIALAPRGAAGFGYDPLFVPDGYDLTFAQMPAEEKNRISHRGRALRRAVEAWAGLLRDLR